MQFVNMKNSLLLFVIFFGLNPFFAQEKEDNLFVKNVVVQQNDTLKKKQTKTDEIIPLDSIRNAYGGRYVDYKYITHAFDTIQIDTTLQIKNYFKHNYTEKDDFEWVGFANQGQTYTKLGYDFIDNKILPIFGATAKLYNYFNIEHIKYYHVPTPTTILYYNQGIDGQVLNSTFTTNFSKFSNLSVAYKGLRSVGDYQSTTASHVNFRTTYSYYNPENRYQFRTHFISQTITNEENGGLTDDAVTEFINDSSSFSSRGFLNVNLEDSESYLKNDRFYYEHELRILNPKDSTKQKITNLKVGHQLNFNKSKYQFDSSDTDYFTDNETIFGALLDEDNDTKDKTEITSLENQVYLKFNSPWILGNFKVFGALNNITQEYDSIKVVDDNTSITNKRKLNYTSFGGSWNGKYKGVFINGYTQQVIAGDYLNSNLHANAGFKLKNNMGAKAGFQLKTVTPNLNTTLNQSNFTNLNWNQDFDSEIYRTIYGSIFTKWIDAKLSIHQIENFTYFDTTSKASQYTQVIDYLKLKINSELVAGKFHFNNSIQYQKVTQGSEIFRVPEFITRNTIYFQDYFFKGDPLFAQIGVTFKYFSKFYANDFNPVLNEFYLQNNTQVGGYPVFSAFVNGKIRRTRIYFKIENFTSDYTGRNYFAASNQPERDFVMRLGIVWNFWN